MNKQTFLEMTQKSHASWFKPTHVSLCLKDRFFSLLSSLHLVSVDCSSNTVVIIPPHIEDAMKVVQDSALHTENGVFGISHTTELHRHKLSLKYQTRKGHKDLYVPYIGECTYTIFVRVHADCQSFDCTLDVDSSGIPRTVHVDSNHGHYSSTIYSFVDSAIPYESGKPQLKFYKTALCKVNFLNARIHCETEELIKSPEEANEELVKECVDRCKLHLKSYIDSHYEEINSKLLADL